jgi:hypothetical protein
MRMSSKKDWKDGFWTDGKHIMPGTYTTALQKFWIVLIPDPNRVVLGPRIMHAVVEECGFVAQTVAEGPAPSFAGWKFCDAEGVEIAGCT